MGWESEVSARDLLLIPALCMAADGFHDIVELLLAHGADASSHPLPMHPAVLAGHRDVIKTLLTVGADLGAVGEFSALRFAEVPDPELLAALLDAGADVNAIDDKGRTPLVLALRCQVSEVDCSTCAHECRLWTMHTIHCAWERWESIARL